MQGCWSNTIREGREGRRKKRRREVGMQQEEIDRCIAVKYKCVLKLDNGKKRRGKRKRGRGREDRERSR